MSLLDTPSGGVDEALEALLYARGKNGHRVPPAKLRRHLPPRTTEDQIDSVLGGLAATEDERLDPQGGNFALTATGLTYARHHRRQRKIAVT